MAEDHFRDPQFFFPPNTNNHLKSNCIKNIHYLKKYSYIAIPLTCNFSPPVTHPAKNALPYTMVGNNQYLLQNVLLKNSLAIINVIRCNVYY